MDIAIKLEKIILDEDRFLFKPISIIKGEFSEEANMFFEENGVAYFSINNITVNEENYFSFPMNLDDLINSTDKDISETYMLSSYLYNHKKEIYFGCVNEDETITIVKVGNEIFKNNSSEDVDESNKISDDGTNNSTKLSLKKVESYKFNLARLRKHLLSTVVAQDDAVNDVSRALAINYTSSNPKNKSHIMIVGPSGTGKTEITNIIASRLKVPVLKVDATDYGKNWHVGSALINLLKITNGDIEKAQNGIIIIDKLDERILEFDDLVRRAILNSFTEIMRRESIQIKIDEYNGFEFDTSNLTLIFTCQFESLYKNNIGFGEKSKISDKDFINYGLTSSFLNEIGTITYTNELSLDDLIKLLYKSSISPIKLKREWFKDRGVSTNFTKDFYTEVARMCKDIGTGAHSLDKIVNNSVKYACDDALIKKDKVKQIKFTSETVINPKKYYIK